MLTSDQNGSSKPKLSNTERKQSQTRGLIPFKKGDPRINRNGRPKTFDQVRALAQELAHEQQKGREAIINVLRSWRDSDEPTLQRAFVEYAFGKVPDKLETTLEHKTKLFLNYSHEESNAREDRSRLPATIPPGAN